MITNEGNQRHKPMIRFEALPESGLQITDTLERLSFELHTGELVNPHPTPTVDFPFPVDRAATIVTGEIAFDNDIGVYIRDETGEFLHAPFKEPVEVQPGTYYIDIQTRAKTYIRVNDAGFTVKMPKTGGDNPTIVFDRTTSLDVGVRSAHSRPAGTITTTEDPRDIMRAFSYLGSSLKELSCERSWSTLRGHPPTIELGNAFRAPPQIGRQKSGITIEVPPELSSIYPIAPLAYYFGATVIPGEMPRIRTAEGASFDLDAKNLGKAAHNVLLHCFTLDTIVRNGGYFEYPSYEKRQLHEDGLDIDTGELYDASLSEQVTAYLKTPFSISAPYTPNAGTVTEVRPVPEDVELLPFLAYSLNRVTLSGSSSTPYANLQKSARKLLSKSRNKLPEVFNQSPDTSDGIMFNSSTAPASTDGSKPLINGYQNQFERSNEGTERTITVIANSNNSYTSKLITELEQYQSQTRPENQFDLVVAYDATIEEVQEHLQSESHLLIFSGETKNTTEFVCSDGLLDISNLPYVNIEGFYLASIDSETHAKELIQKGGISGVTPLHTNNKLIHEVSIRVIQILNAGFPLNAAVKLASEVTDSTHQYRILGSPEASVFPKEKGEYEIAAHIDSRDDDQFNIRVQTFQTTRNGLGGYLRPYFDGVDESLLYGSEYTYEGIAAESFLKTFQDSESVVFLPDGSFKMSNTLTESDLLSDSTETETEN